MLKVRYQAENSVRESLDLPCQLRERAMTPETSRQRCLVKTACLVNARTEAAVKVPYRRRTLKSDSAVFTKFVHGLPTHWTHNLGVGAQDHSNNSTLWREQKIKQV
jgi:hypothetical protein